MTTSARLNLKHRPVSRAKVAFSNRHSQAAYRIASRFNFLNLVSILLHGTTSSPAEETIIVLSEKQLKPPSCNTRVSTTPAEISESAESIARSATESRASDSLGRWHFLRSCIAPAQLPRAQRCRSAATATAQPVQQLVVRAALVRNPSRGDSIALPAHRLPQAAGGAGGISQHRPNCQACSAARWWQMVSCAAGRALTTICTSSIARG